MNSKKQKCFVFIILFSTFSQYLLAKPDYFPLEIGNKWIYDRLDANGCDIYEIIDTTRISNTLFYKLEQNILGWDSKLIVFFYKDSLNQIWSLENYSPFENKVLRYKLNGEINEDWFLNSRVKAALIDTLSVQSTAFGNIEKCYHFQYDYISNYITEHFWLAPNIGLIHWEAEGEGALLKGAVINGIVIGDTVTVETSIDRNLSTPLSVQLYQNYPNPFNNQTTITFTMDYEKPQHVKLKIIDILGRVCVNILDTELTNGEYKIVWDGTDSYGNLLSSGLYYYQLATDQYLETRALLLLK